MRIGRTIRTLRRGSCVLAAAALLASVTAATSAAATSAGAAGAAAQQAPQITTVSQSSPALPALTTLDIDADVSASFTNPDDPAQIAVSAAVTAPDGQVTQVPGFYYQDYAISGDEVLPHGSPVWQIRYTPPSAGDYRYTVSVTTPGGQAVSAPGRFQVTPARPGSPGYVRVDPANPAYFSFTGSGATLFPMGFDLDVPELTKAANHQADPTARYHGIFGDGITAPATGQSPQNLYTMYEYYRTGLEKLAAAGGNSVRIILDSWLLPLELQPDNAWPGYPDGVPGFTIGQYNAPNAWLVDQIMDLAQQYGIYVTLVAWDSQTSGDAYTAYASPSTANVSLMEQRLRYQVARWGYSTHLMAWELFNEANIDPTAAPYAQVVSYLRSIDPGQHLIFNSYNGVDETETHTYLCGDGETDPSSPYYYQYCPQQQNFLYWADFAPTSSNPDLMSEYGEKWYFRLPADTDPTGTRAHEGLWATLMGHKAGAEYWWYYAHIYPLNLYDDVYQGISRYLAGVDLGAYDWQAASFTQESGPGGLSYYGMEEDTRIGQQPDQPGDPRALLWFVRTPSNDYTDLPAANGNVVRLNGMQPGKYTIDWYSTQTGSIIATQTTSDDGSGGVDLDVPDGVTRDIAAKVYGPEQSTHLTVDGGTSALEQGGTGTISATLTSTGATPPPTGITMTLQAPAGWTVTAAGPTTVPGPLTPGKSVTATWNVTVPADAAPTSYSLTASASYQSGQQQDTATQPFTESVAPPPLSSYGPVQSPYQTFASTNASFYQDGGDFAIDAGGVDEWTDADDYGSVYLAQAAGTDTTATTEVTYQEDSNAKAHAGIIMRDSIPGAGSSPGYVVVAVTPANGFVLNWDSNGDGLLDAATSAGTTQYPCWLKLVRSGSTYTGYYSTDDQTWHTIGTVTAPGGSATEDVGLVDSAHSATATSRADFSDFTVQSGSS